MTVYNSNQQFSAGILHIWGLSEEDDRLPFPLYWFLFSAYVHALHFQGLQHFR